MNVFLQQLVNSLVLGSAYVLVTLGLFLVLNMVGIPNFAHGEMLTLGAYFTFALSTQLSLPFLPAVVGAVAGVAIVGLVIKLAVFDRLPRGTLTAAIVASLGLSIVIQEAIGLIWGITPVSVSSPLSGVEQFGAVRISSYRAILIAVALVTALALGSLVFRSTFGRTLRGVAQNPALARLSSINDWLVGTKAFVLGCGIAGLAGALLSPTGKLSPSMGFQPMLVGFVILVAVGTGGRLIAILAAGFTLAALETLAAGYVANSSRTLIVFLALILFLTIRPNGLFVELGKRKVRL